MVNNFKIKKGTNHSICRHLVISFPDEGKFENLLAFKRTSVIFSSKDILLTRCKTRFAYTFAVETELKMFLNVGIGRTVANA